MTAQHWGHFHPRTPIRSVGHILILMALRKNSKDWDTQETIFNTGADEMCRDSGHGEHAQRMRWTCHHRAQEVMVAAYGEEERLAKTIIDGATSKQELIAQLGVPLDELGDRSVLIFGGRYRSRGLLQLVKDDKRDEHRLIAILDKNEILREHLWVGKKVAAKNIQTAVAE